MPGIAEVLDEELMSPRGVCPTGFSRLDTVTGGFRAGQVWLVTAAPGDGRSLLSLQWAIALTRRGVPTRLTSPRQPMWDLRDRVIAHAAGVAVTEVAHDSGRTARIEMAREELRCCPLVVSEALAAPPSAARGDVCALVVDDADLVTTPADLGSVAHEGAVVIASLPLDVVVSNAGLHPAWSRIADVVLQVDTRAWADTDLTVASRLRMLKHRWGPLVDQPVWFEPAYARFRDTYQPTTGDTP